MRLKFSAEKFQSFSRVSQFTKSFQSFKVSRVLFGIIWFPDWSFRVKVYEKFQNYLGILWFSDWSLCVKVYKKISSDVRVKSSKSFECPIWFSLKVSWEKYKSFNSLHSLLGWSFVGGTVQDFYSFPTEVLREKLKKQIYYQKIYRNWAVEVRRPTNFPNAKFEWAFLHGTKLSNAKSSELLFPTNFSNWSRLNYSFPLNFLRHKLSNWSRLKLSTSQMRVDGIISSGETFCGANFSGVRMSELFPLVKLSAARDVRTGVDGIILFSQVKDSCVQRLFYFSDSRCSNFYHSSSFLFSSLAENNCGRRYLFERFVDIGWKFRRRRWKSLWNILSHATKTFPTF